MILGGILGTAGARCIDAIPPDDYASPLIGQDRN